MMTTKSVGMDTDVANPKPVRHVNWTGQPMKEGDSYWGESKPQPVPPPKEAPKARVRKVKRSWTAEQIEAMRARMAIARAKRRPTNSVAVNQQQGES